MSVGQQTPADMEAIIRQEFEGAGQDPNLGVAIGRHESNLDPSATNMTGGDLRRGGSFGLMQMSLATARDLGFNGPASALRDPALNARLAAKLVKNLSSRYPDQRDVISAYNSGRPLAQAPESTRAVYVPGVLKHLQQAGAATENAPEGSGMGRQKMQIDPVYLRGPAEQSGVAPQAAQPAPPPQSPPDARSALGDPAFVSYLRDRAQQLSQAQGDAAGRQRWADMAGAFERGGAMIGNRPVDRDQIASLNARAQLPVAQLQQQQNSESQGIKDLDTAQQVQERGLKAGSMRDSLDPASGTSRRSYLLAVAQKLIPASYPQSQFSASMYEEMKAGATLETARQHYEALAGIAKAHLGIEQGKLDEEKRYHDMTGDLKLHPALAPQQVTELESLISGVKALDDLKGARDTSGIVDKGLSLVGMGDYAATKTAAAGEVAKADAKGRANPTGAAREAKLLPGALTPGGDKQLQDRRRHMLEAAEQRINMLEAGGARPAEIAMYRQQLEALKQPSETTAPKAKPTGDTAALRAKYGL